MFRTPWSPHELTLGILLVSGILSYNHVSGEGAYPIPFFNEMDVSKVSVCIIGCFAIFRICSSIILRTF